MRKTVLSTLVLSFLLASAPALAATAPTTTETGRLEWREGDHHLVVDASQGIVRVTTTEPANYFGARSGDRILRIDGKPVRSIDDLTGYLAASSRSQVPMTVLRKGNQVTVSIDPAAWGKVLPPAPPAPPAPPPPPPRPGT